MKKTYCSVFLVLAAILFLTGYLEAGQYQYVDLGTLTGGTKSSAWGLNNKDQIAGWAGTATSQGEQARAVWWDLTAWTIQDIGVGDNSIASKINNKGQMVGAASYSTYDAWAFLFDTVSQTGKYLENTLSCRATWANGINDQGQVVGDAYFSPWIGSGYYNAFLWDPVTKSMQSLGTLGGTHSWASDINNKGQIVGTSNVVISGFERPHACFWEPAEKQMQDLGVLGQGDLSAAYALNSQGQVVGESNLIAGGNPHAILVTPGQPMQDLGTLTGNYSQAWGINDGGQVVGEYGVTSTQGQTSYAFLWTAAEGMQDLNKLVVNLPPKVTLQLAFDINKSGCIVGFTSDNRAFFLKPVAAMPHLPILLFD